jgi:hypothetical protein
MREGDHLEDQGIDGLKILKWIFKRKGQVAGTFECSEKPSGSIKCGEFPDSLTTC